MSDYSWQDQDNPVDNTPDTQPDNAPHPDEYPNGSDGGQNNNYYPNTGFPNSNGYPNNDFQNNNNYPNNGFQNNNNYQNNGFQDNNSYMPTGSTGMATASLVLGICALVFSCCGGSCVFGAIGIILAILSRGAGRMNTQAKVGLGLSIGSIFLGIIMVIFFMISSISSGALQDYAHIMEEYSEEYSDALDSMDDPYGNFGENFSIGQTFITLSDDVTA
ncbi:MAG: DUF4190 domain-containing protein [Lachnospiraceae bacterium]|nr:DUF4190 domain-containing protein [Lachnospiraceae bacterium]